MWKTYLLLVGFVAGFALPAAAHDIITTKLTYTRDISRIFSRRCVGCHSESSSVPLTSYEQVRPWAVDIKEQVISRAMPPWGAVKGFGDLDPDLGLSQEEVLIVAAWVVGGAPQGDLTMLPKTAERKEQPSTGSLSDAVMVSTKLVLRHSIKVAGVKPAAIELVPSARIIAHLPDGRIQPLVWLYQYDPRWKQTFKFREPVALPAGTTVESNSPLRYTLETLVQSASTGMVNTTVLTTPWR
jgi:hypothetical protein